MGITANEKELLMFYSRLDESQKVSLLTLLKSFVKEDTDAFKPVTIEQYNEELRLSEEQIEAGQFIRQEDLEKELKLWR